MKKSPIIEKFYIPKQTKFWSTIALLLSIAIYVIMLSVISKISQSGQVVSYGFIVVRDISLVVATILLTTFLTGQFVEVRSKNELYRDTVLQDVVSNPAFYNSFSDETKQIMLSNLEKDLLFQNSLQIQRMYGSIRKKLSQVRLDKYYFDSCNFHIRCSVEGQAIIKTITRTVKMRSYDEVEAFKDFKLLCWAGDGVDDPFSLIRIEMNGRVIDSSQYECIRIEEHEQSEIKASHVYYCIYKPELHLYSDRETTVSIVYISKVSISDNNYTCRTSVPCEHFSVDFQLQTTGYRLNAAAFGFLDKAKKSPISVGEREVRVEFDDWVYSEDGVSISIARII